MLLRPATDQISRDLTAVLSAIPAGFDHLWATDFRIIPLTAGFPIALTGSKLRPPAGQSSVVKSVEFGGTLG